MTVKKKDDELPQVRVVKKVFYDQNSKPAREWYEVQYYTPTSGWRGYRRYGSTLTFKDKNEALNFAMRKKAGAKHNSVTTEVIA